MIEVGDFGAFLYLVFFLFSWPQLLRSLLIRSRNDLWIWQIIPFAWLPLPIFAVAHCCSSWRYRPVSATHISKMTFFLLKHACCCVFTVLIYCFGSCFFFCWSFHSVSFHLYACILKSFLADLLNDQPAIIVFRLNMCAIEHERKQAKRRGREIFGNREKISRANDSFFIHSSFCFLILFFSFFHVAFDILYDFTNPTKDACTTTTESGIPFIFPFPGIFLLLHSAFILFLVHFLRTIWLMNIEIDWMILIVAYYSTWLELKVEKVENASQFVHISFVPNISFIPFYSVHSMT